MKRILWYFKVFGMQGLLIASVAIVVRKPVRLKVYSAKLKTWINIRTKTSDLSVYEKVVINEEYKLPEWIDPKTIIDAGANIGISSLYFSLIYPQAMIIAIEPESSNFAMLKDNTASQRRIHLVRAAIWNENKMLNLYGETNSDFQVGDGYEGDDIDGVTLDELMRRLSIDYIDVLKVDIEGAEKEVFDSSEKWIEKVGMLVIELHERFRPGCEKAVRNAAATFNKTWEYGENSFFVRNTDA